MSKSNARPCDIDWVRSIVRQCKAAGVACFTKQGGANLWDGEKRIKTIDSKGGDLNELPEDIRVREFPASQTRIPRL